MIHDVQNSFNGGALSPYTSARPELEIYQSGCKTMVNFMAMPYGGARYRAGTQFMGFTKNNSVACLYGFEFSTNSRNVLEFGIGYLRFFKTGIDTAEQIMSGNEPLEVSTPYTVDDLRHLQFAQLNDIVIITHPNHPPYRLSRLAEDDWVMEIYPFSRHAHLDDVLDEDSAITATGTTGEVTLNAASDIFKPNHVGSEFQLGYRRTNEEIQLELEMARGTDELEVMDQRTGQTKIRTGLLISESLRVTGDFLIQSFGTWTATIEIFRRRLEDDFFEEYLIFSGSNNRNVNEEYTLDEDAELIVAISGYASDTNARVALSVTDPFIRGRVIINRVTAPNQAIGTVVADLAEGATSIWSESAFSERSGYPRAVTFHAQRLWFGGTVSRPQQIWSSRIDSYDDFARPFGTDGVSDADAPISLPIFADQQNTVEWMSSNRSLLIGTSSGEFVVTGETNEDNVGVNDFLIRRHTSNGSEAYQALPVDSAVIFVQRQGRRLRKMGYRFENDAYESEDLTIYNEHLTRGGIVELAYQRQREPIIWGITRDSKMIGWTYRPQQPFLAAYEMQTPGGKFESVTVVFGDEDEDEQWVIVNRGGNRCIERIRPDQVLAQETGDLSSLWFLDAAVEFRSPTARCTGLNHLEGQEVQIFSDNSFAGKATVINGEIKNPRPLSTRTLVGLHYGGEFETMPIEIQTQEGSSQGRTKKAGRAVIRTFQSLTGEWFTSQNPLGRPFHSIAPTSDLSAARELRDSNEVFTSHPGAERILTIGVRQTHPYPLTVLAVAVRVTVNERT